MDLMYSLNEVLNKGIAVRTNEVMKDLLHHVGMDDNEAYISVYSRLDHSDVEDIWYRINILESIESVLVESDDSVFFGQLKEIVNKWSKEFNG